VVPDVDTWNPQWFDIISAGFWVGIDGIAFESGGNQLLQAGIAVDVRPRWERYVPPFLVRPPLRWRAWTEWWSQEFADTDAANAVYVSNFQVRSGDTMSFLVCAEQPDFGYV
jgi:hypothetical protein